jgi:CheY-like chemotaxis protein
MPEKKKILIVEDEKALARALGQRVEKAGMKPITSYNGRDALVEVEKTKPDLILLDILLPKLSGIEFLTKIKKDKKLANIPVIVLSNYSGEDIISQCLEVGVLQYLIKANSTLDKVIEEIGKTLNI